MILAIFGVTVIIIVGYSILRLLKINTFGSLLESLPYYFGVGVGAISLQMYLYSRLGISWSLLNLLTVWVILFLVLTRVKLGKFSLVPKEKFSFLGKIIFVFCICLAVFIGFEAVIRPVSAWDGWSIWLLKSKIFFIDGMIKPDIFSYVESDYPLIISLAGTFLYEVMGRVDDTNVLLLFYFFYLMLGISFYFYLRKNTSSTVAIIFTFLLLSTQNILRHGGRYEAGQADLALGFYFFITAVLLLEYIRNKDFKTLLLCNIVLGITALVKNEGVTYVLIAQVIIILHVIKSKKYKHLFTSLLCALPILDWYSYKEIINMPKNFLLVNSSLRLDRIALLIKEMVLEFINFSRWNLTWVYFIITTILSFRHINRYFPLYALILGQLSIYFIIYLITPVNPLDHLRSSFNRLIIHIAPLVILLSGILTYSILNSTQSPKNIYLKKALKLLQK